MRKILEIGAGKNPYQGKSNEKVIHLDIIRLPHIEVIHDLNKFPWPFKNNEFDEVLARHVFEHLNDVVRTMKEIGRILKSNGILKIWVPYFASPDAYVDLTHKHFFTLKSFDYWDDSTLLGGVCKHEVGNIKFKIMKKELQFPKICKFFIINIFAKKFPNVYEHFFSRIFPACEVYFELKIVK
jgi:SAM-dependent methyltransferase